MLFIPSRDGGPIYTETNFNHFWPEPFNTITSLLFTLISLFWFLKLKKESSRNTFLWISNSILFIGSIGGSLYHGLRRYHVFLVMDYLPILILCFLAGFYFLFRSLNSVTKSFLWILGIFLVLGLLHYLTRSYPRSWQININYGFLGLLVVSSTLIYLQKIQYQYFQWIIAALLSFILALFFRIADPWKWLPMGTHFLWHIGGALATSFMLKFINESGKIEMNK